MTRVLTAQLITKTDSKPERKEKAENSDHRWRFIPVALSHARVWKEPENEFNAKVSRFDVVLKENFVKAFA